MIQRCRQVLLVVLFYLGGPLAYSQNYEVDTASIREVVTLWNEAHNEINEDSFNDLYASTLLFYSNYLDKKACIEKKLSLLHQGPFHQELVSDLQLTFYEEGIVYCGFTKEVSTAKGKKSYPSYLLMKRLDDRYVITGESDLVTDRNLKFHLSLGPQIHISELSSVLLPKRSKFKSVYGVAILVLLLGAAGAVIYFFKRRSARKTGNKEKVSSESSSTKEINLTNEKVPDEQHWKQIELKKGHAFEQFVVNRFKQRGDFFKWMDATSDKGSQGYYPASNQNPDLQYEFHFGGKSYPFSVECKFRSMAWGSIKLTNDGQIGRYKKFEIEKGMPVFIVLGLGGTPESPAELFVIPLSHVKQRMDWNELQDYKAEPKFYYRISEGRLY